MTDKSLQYQYKGDQTIPIGVLGMVDDTLAIGDCGNPSIKKKEKFFCKFVYRNTKIDLIPRKKCSIALWQGKQVCFAMPNPQSPQGTHA